LLEKSKRNLTISHTKSRRKRLDRIGRLLPRNMGGATIRKKKNRMCGGSITTRETLSNNPH